VGYGSNQETRRRVSKGALCTSEVALYTKKGIAARGTEIRLGLRRVVFFKSHLSNNKILFLQLLYEEVQNNFSHQSFSLQSKATSAIEKSHQNVDATFSTLPRSLISFIVSMTPAPARAELQEIAHPSKIKSESDGYEPKVSGEQMCDCCRAALSKDAEDCQKTRHSAMKFISRFKFTTLKY